MRCTGLDRIGSAFQADGEGAQVSKGMGAASGGGWAKGAGDLRRDRVRGVTCNRNRDNKEGP